MQTFQWDIVFATKQICKSTHILLHTWHKKSAKSDFSCKGRRPRDKKPKGAAENQRNAWLCIAGIRKPGFLDKNSSVHTPSGGREKMDVNSSPPQPPDGWVSCQARTMLPEFLFFKRWCMAGKHGSIYWNLAPRGGSPIRKGGDLGISFLLLFCLSSYPFTGPFESCPITSWSCLYASKLMEAISRASLRIPITFMLSTWSI